MKLLTLILSMLMTVSLAACDTRGPHPSAGGTPPAVSSETTDGAANGNDGTAIQHAVGDIVLADGTVTTAAELTSVDSANPPVAVIAGIRDDGAPFGVGVHRSNTPLQWAPASTAGNLTNFTETACTDSSTGDTDGSDNWDVICAEDAQGAADAEKNYPAFYFINTYADAFKLPESCAGGWYLPSIAELCTVYENREAINASLEKINELDNGASMDGLGTNWYWSSSQSGSSDDYAWFVHYFNGYAADCPKDFDNLHVLAVRAF